MTKLFTLLSLYAAASAVAVESSDKGYCVWDVDHHDCFGTLAEAEFAETAYSLKQCLLHADGSTHGPHCPVAHSKPACGAVVLGHYDMAMHIASIFIVLVTSFLGVMLPTIAGWLKGPDVAHLDSASIGREYGIWGCVFFFARHIGTGIIISTAFIHLLYDGFMMFSDPCLGTLVFPPTAPAIALAGAFVTFLLDFVAAWRQGVTDVRDDREKGEEEPCSVSIDTAERRKASWQVLLLEAGIIFHSVMIGVTLGADSSPGWTTLLLVIVFHQLFEGAALGARIASLHWQSRLHTILQILAFMLTTPIGIAIGIGVRQSFSANGTAALVSIGILDSTSAGILLYSSLKLLMSDFVDGPLKNATGFRVFMAFACLTTGLVIMSVLGRWV